MTQEVAHPFVPGGVSPRGFGGPGYCRTCGKTERHAEHRTTEPEPRISVHRIAGRTPEVWVYTRDGRQSSSGYPSSEQAVAAAKSAKEL